MESWWWGGEVGVGSEGDGGVVVTGGSLWSRVRVNIIVAGTVPERSVKGIDTVGAKRIELVENLKDATDGVSADDKKCPS